MRLEQQEWPGDEGLCKAECIGLGALDGTTGPGKELGRCDPIVALERPFSWLDVG